MVEYRSGKRRELDPASARWREVLIALLLAGCIITAFFQVTAHHFLTWDDYENVARNTRFNSATPKSIAWFWHHFYLSMYIPLTYTV